MQRLITFSLFFLLATKTIVLGQAADSTAELQRFQGSWRVTELIEDGRVIPQVQIKNILPSGGQAEIISNTIQFTAPTSGKKAKVFSIDPTVYPKTIVVSTLDRPEGSGIYRFEGERLIICMADPTVATRPTEFASRPGTRHMLMVLQRGDTVARAAPQPQPATAPRPQPATAPRPQPATAPRPQPNAKVHLPAPPVQAPAPSAPAARLVSDAEVKAMLLGSWRLNDGAGVLQVGFDPRGTFHTYREVPSATTFHRVFVQTPVSAGTWSVQNGNLIFLVTSSTDFTRVNQKFYVSVRSISQTDLIFVDYMGRVVKAVKVR